MLLPLLACSGKNPLLVLVLLVLLLLVELLVPVTFTP
jgi:hypothetical protein